MELDFSVLAIAIRYLIQNDSTFHIFTLWNFELRTFTNTCEVVGAGEH